MAAYGVRRACAVLLALAALAPAACSPSQSPDAKSAAEAAKKPLNPVVMDDHRFSSGVYQLLLNVEDGSVERLNLLAGVVRHQLIRAGQRFSSGHPDAGLQALSGALYLLDPSEFRVEMLQGDPRPLLQAASEVARLGDEGRALALYRMLKGLLPKGSKERQEVDGHLKALAAWSRVSADSGPLQALGHEQRALTRRALFEPTQAALDAAVKATVRWIEQAVQINIGEPIIQTPSDREELLEVYRATRTAGLVIIALHLHRGQAAGALKALESSQQLRVPPTVQSRLERAAEDDDPAAWQDLYRLYNSVSQQQQAEPSIDPELADAAAWGAAVELYRLEPGSVPGALPLAVELVQHGMAEVMPLVLASASPDATARDLSAAVSLILRAIVAEDEVSQLAAARRTFENAKPIIELASSPSMLGKIRPSAARLHYVMGALEMRGGELGRARPHMEVAARAEPNMETLMSLAAIDRQRGQASAAQAALQKAVEFARKHSDAASEAEALIVSFEIYRDASQQADADKTLRAALTRCLEARRQANSDAERARAERLLARVLEHYGNEDAARRATERAYEAARSDVRQFAATILDASRRALTRGDLPAARDAVRRAIEARLPDEDIIYVALWLQLLERQLNVPSDGTAEEAYAAIENADGWPAKLRSWGRGKMNDEQLLRAARDRVQRTEAMFYTAMARHAEGKREAAVPKLRQVAESEAVELVEVTIARDLLAEPKALRLPDGVDVP